LTNIRNIFLVFIFGALIFLAIWLIPEYLLSGRIQCLNTKDQIEVVNESRKTIAQIFGGLIILVGVYLTYKRVTALERNVEIAQQGQITERFSRAIEQLGSERLAIRLGGIYSLERIAKESKKDFIPIMEVFSAYLRKNSPIWKSKPKEKANEVAIDINAIITAIGRRSTEFHPENFKIDLNDVWINGLLLDDMNFSNISFINSDLSRSVLNDVILKNADLVNTNMEKFTSVGGDFRESFLFEVNMRDSHLDHSNLQGVLLDTCILKDIDFCQANLNDVDFGHANISGCDFRDANLIGIKLTNYNQFKDVKTLYNAKIDNKLQSFVQKNYPYLLEKPKNYEE